MDRARSDGLFRIHHRVPGAQASGGDERRSRHSRRRQPEPSARSRRLRAQPWEVEAAGRRWEGSVVASALCHRCSTAVHSERRLLHRFSGRGHLVGLQQRARKVRKTNLMSHASCHVLLSLPFQSFWDRFANHARVPRRTYHSFPHISKSLAAGVLGAQHDHPKVSDRRRFIALCVLADRLFAFFKKDLGIRWHLLVVMRRQHLRHQDHRVQRQAGPGPLPEPHRADPLLLRGCADVEGASRAEGNIHSPTGSGDECRPDNDPQYLYCCVHN